MGNTTDMDAEKDDGHDMKEEGGDDVDMERSSKKQRIENNTEGDGSLAEKQTKGDIDMLTRQLEELKMKAEEAEKKAEEAEKKAEDERKKRQEAEKKTEEARRKRQEAEKKAEEARKKREEAEKKAEEEEKKTEEAEKKAEEARKKREEAEKKAEEEEKKREAADTLNSVEDLLTAIPHMTPNSACPPSVIPNREAQGIVTRYRCMLAEFEASLKLFKEGSPRSKGDYKNKPKPPDKFNFHEPAQIKIRQIDPGLFDFNINVVRPDGLKVKSGLSIKADNGRGYLQHSNETSPRDAFDLVINDVVRCSRVHGITVVKEATLFSLRPDLVVVLVNGFLLFVCKIKNPSQDDGAVFSSETVASQVLAYAHVSKQNGMDWPFVILSTYNHSAIATLPTPDDGAIYREILQQGSVNASQEPPKRVGPTNETPRKKPFAPSVSPSQDNMLGWKCGVIEPIIASEGVQQADNEEEEATNEETDSTENTMSSESGYDYRGREVVFSQTFNHEMNYKMVALILESALVASEQSKNSDRPLIPKEGTSLNGQYCTLTETGFSWEPVNIKRVTYNKAPSIMKMKKYHVLCQLGQGGSVKTILCCSSGGKMLCVKLFLLPHSTQYREADRKTEFARALEQKKKEAEEECGRWHLLAPAFRSFCHVITLNGLPAITMPYFQPIPFGKRDDSIDIVDRKLKEAGVQGFYYPEDEMRWRRFGCRWADEETIQITLLDLGSLHKNEVGQGNDVDAEMLRRQIDSLRSRSGNEEISEAKTVFV